jgi:SPP1 family predicted phage head-tail adaptor
MIKFSLMKERISLFNRTLTADDMGGKTVTLTVFGSRWAHLKAIKAVEKVAQGGLLMESDFLCRLRYDSTIDEKMLVYWESAYWEITSLLHIDNDETELLIKRVRE